MAARRLRIGSGLLGVALAVMLTAAGTAGAGWFLPEVRVTTNAQMQLFAAISGTRVVYQDYRNGNWDVYLYDLATRTERRLTTDPADQLYPAISGDRVVYVDSRRAYQADIYLYDLTTNTEKRVSKSSDHMLGPPRISGTRVVCSQQYSAGGNDIMLYDLVTGFEHRFTVAGHQWSPDISGKKIVYEDAANGYRVYLYDLATNSRKRLTSSGSSHRPSISGSNVVYQDLRNGTWDIYLYDLKSGEERRLTTAAAKSFRVMISGTKVASIDTRHDTSESSDEPSTSEVYVYDLTTGIEKLVASLDVAPGRAAVSASRVVYEDVRGGNRDIYLKELAYPKLTANAPAVVEYGARAQVTGTLTGVSDAGGGDVGLAGRTIVLYDSPNGSSWRTRGSVQTGPGGAYAIDTPPLTKARYFRVGFAGDAGYLGVTAARLRVKPKVRLGTPKVPSWIGVRQSFTAWGSLEPRHAAGSYPVRLKLYQERRLADGSRGYVLRRTVRAKASDSSGHTRYAATLRAAARGDWAVRAYHPADSAHAATYSGWRYFTVK